MISAKTIEEIRQKARIIELIGDHVELKQRGTNFVGLCPFHGEKTPSFNVSEVKNSYHCFGCGASGNVISFIMEKEGLSFPDTVEYLANRYNIHVEREGKTKSTEYYSEKKRNYIVNHLAQQFFKDNLKKAPAAVKKYLESRKLRQDAIDTFGIGFAPNDWRQLTDSLLKEKYSETELIKYGVSKKSAKADLYDSFRGRLIFPVHMDSKRILGFGGRLLPDMGEGPKYLNSKETPVYQKSYILYGLPQALPSFKLKKFSYLVEGYMDVVGLWQAGVSNVVATCGTSVTSSHIQKLGNYVTSACLLFDGDSAGRAAAAKCFSVFLNSGVDGKAIFLPDGEDPDSFATKHGDKTSEELAKIKGVGLLEVYIRSLLSKYGVENVKDLQPASKAKLAEEVKKNLTKVENKIEYEELVKEASYLLMVLPEHLKNDVKKVKEKVEVEKVSDVGESDNTKIAIQKLSKLNKEILLIAMTQRAKITSKLLNNSVLCEVLHADVLSFIQSLNEIFSTSSENQKESLMTLLQNFGKSWTEHWKLAHVMLDDKSVNFDKLYDECILLIEKKMIEKSILEHAEMLRSGDLTEEQKLNFYQEKLRLERKVENI